MPCPLFACLFSPEVTQCQNICMKEKLCYRLRIGYRGVSNALLRVPKRLSASGIFICVISFGVSSPPALSCPAPPCSCISTKNWPPVCCPRRCNGWCSRWRTPFLPFLPSTPKTISPARPSPPRPKPKKPRNPKSTKPIPATRWNAIQSAGKSCAGKCSAAIRRGKSSGNGWTPTIWPPCSPPPNPSTR